MVTLTELRANFVAAVREEGGVNSLTLGSQVVAEAAMLLRYLGQDAVAFSGVVVGLIQNDRFEVTGTVVAFGGDNEATLTVRVMGDGTPQLSLKLSPLAANWGFQDAFPDLPQSPGSDGVFAVLKESCFYDLSVSQPILTVSTFENAQMGIEEGVVFDAQLSLGDTFDALRRIIGSQHQIACHGSIDMSGSPPLIRLEAMLGDLTFPLAGDAIKDIVIRIETTEPSEDAPARSRTLLRGQVVVSSSAPPVTLEASILEGDFVWQFRALFAEDELSLANGFAELAQLAGIQSTDFKLPDEVKAFTSFYLTEIEVGLIPAETTIQYVSFAVASLEVWHTRIPDIQITNLGVGWTFLLGTPLTSYGYVFGDLVLGRGAGQFTLEVSARLPDFVIFAELSEGEEIDLRKITETYFGGYPFEHDFVVDRLELTTEPNASSYEAAIEIKDDWPIIANLTLSPMSFAIRAQDGSVSGSLTAQFNLDELKFFVRAVYPDGGGGWQFLGGSLTNEPIPIAHLVQKLATQFDVTSDFPKALDDLSIETLLVSYNTKTKDFSFDCETRFPLGDDERDLVIHIDIQHQGSDTFTKTFSGKLTIDGRVFDVVFAADGSATMFLAAYHKDNGDTIDVKNLMETVSRDVANAVPEGLSITLNDALLAYSKTDTAKYLFGLEMGAGINLSNLPLVGRVFPPEDTIKLIFQLLVASAALPEPEVTAINGLIPNGVTKLPAGALGTGLTLSTPMQFGNTNAELSLPVQVADTASNPDQPLETTAQNTDVKWFALQKTFGPVHFNRIGAAFRDGELWFLLDASFATAGLTLSLEGLAVSSPLNAFRPQFHLEGLGIDYQNGPLEIGGSFLRTTVPANGGQAAYDEYSGKAIIKTDAFSLSARGSYAYLNDHPSLFVYGVLDYPLGGPSFFFVTGLAAGFGYNRALNIPPLE